MKKTSKILVLLLLVMLTVPLAIGEAFNLGGITINLPGGGSSQGGGGKQDGGTPSTQADAPGLSDHPTKIEVTLNSPVGFDEHSKYFVRGRVSFADKPGMKVPEYTEAYITPANSYLEGNVFHGGYYGNGHTNTDAVFRVPCKPGNYVLLIYVNNYACVAPVTAEANGEVASYVMKKLPGDLKFAK